VCPGFETNLAGTTSVIPACLVTPPGHQPSWHRSMVMDIVALSR